jgi:3-oxoacyl-[acyl-carrier-protein] synthase-1
MNNGQAMTAQRMKPLAVAAHTLVTALGAGLSANWAALAEGRTGLAKQDFETATLGTWLGVVADIDALDWPAELAAFDCRNNRLAELTLRSDGFAEAVHRAARRWGAARVGVFLGTSTAGILQTELAYRRRDPATGALPPDLHYAETHNTYSVARYVRARLGLAGPAFVVSTACSSSAKVYAAAARMIALGLVDAAVVGGVDSLCMTTLYGFRSLELLSPDICRPWDAERAGLSLGEAGALALLTRDGDAPQAWLLGAGESSDGHHMSSPHPEGAGAALAIRAALAQAGLAADEVDYLNLHGTGTPGNDAAEDRAVTTVFGTQVACSSTKGYTGHTLGAAGGVEASVSMLALQHGLAPAGLNVLHLDPALRTRYLREPQRRPLRVVASNSFGFGGSNACLVFGAAGAAGVVDVFGAGG